jgi:hypothetical protein
MKILYVENHAVFAAQVCQQFLSAHSVQVVPSVAAAKNALASETCDLLIVDYDLYSFANVRRHARHTDLFFYDVHSGGFNGVRNLAAMA